MGSANRWDETWHRLREWTNGQGPSERLAAQILSCEGYVAVDPSHPLGGPDGGKDAVCKKDGELWVMAVFFPRGQQTFGAIESKFSKDTKGAAVNGASGIAFVTNQELTLSERRSLIDSAQPMKAELFHLERIASLLDRPEMAGVREQFLGIDGGDGPTIYLGGIGGMAPGAGGGGGGALGSNARGGDGGRGGNLVFAGRPVSAPGAGGGGEGAIGEDADGGDGGNGGQMVHLEIGPDHLEHLRKQGFHRIEFRVGEGGREGGPGEDTIAHLVAEDGRVLESVVAKGGAPGISPRRAGGREVTAEDMQAGLCLTSLMLAECAQLKFGLLSLLGAGWEHFEFPAVPFQAQWPLAGSLSTGSAVPGTTWKFRVLVRDPTGFQVLEEWFTVSASCGPVSRPLFLVPLQFTGSQPGVWELEVSSGALRATHSIEVRVLRNAQP